MKYILYARKSSEDKGRQMLSLDSQISTMEKLAADLGLSIVKKFAESKSAKNPNNRPCFSEMLEMIEQGKADGIICWKLDRLSRNPIDSGKIQWMSQQGIIKDIQTSERRYLPDDNALVFNVESGMANQYIRDLSLNVKRGNKSKLAKGGWLGLAPLGYLNDKVNKTIYIDSERASYVQKAFDLYATGSYSVKDVANILYDEGLRTRGGYKVHKSKIHRVLSDPAYIGMVRHHGKLYQGVHEPLISHQAFENVQTALFGKAHSKKQKHFFHLRGKVRCGHCGCAFTASKKKGHDYYHCTNGKGICDEHKKYLRSEVLDEIVAKALEQIQFDPELVEMAYLASKEKLNLNENYRKGALENITKQLEIVAKKKSKLLDSHLSDLITNDVYEVKMKELGNDETLLQAQHKKIEINLNSCVSTLEPTKEVFLRANRAKKEFLDAENCKKREVLENLLWNIEIKDQVLANVSYKMPCEAMKKSPKMVTFSEMSDK